MENYTTEISLFRQSMIHLHSHFATGHAYIGQYPEWKVHISASKDETSLR